MLVIRLRRIGKKNKPSYRIVVAEHTMPIQGKFVEDIGFYNPHTKTIGLKKDRASEWLKKGAKPSNTVAKLMIHEKMKHDSIVVVKKNKKAKSVKVEKPVAAVAPDPTSQVEPTEAPVASDEPSGAAEEITETPATEEVLPTEPTVEVEA